MKPLDELHRKAFLHDQAAEILRVDAKGYEKETKRLQAYAMCHEKEANRLREEASFLEDRNMSFEPNRNFKFRYHKLSQCGSSLRITATLEFSETGYLMAIYPGCSDGLDQDILEKALSRILNIGHASLIKTAFQSRMKS